MIEDRGAINPYVEQMYFYKKLKYYNFTPKKFSFEYFITRVAVESLC